MGIVSQPLRVDVIGPPVIAGVALGHRKIPDLAMWNSYSGRTGLFFVRRWADITDGQTGRIDCIGAARYFRKTVF